jgi:hypothetical protein
MADEVTPTPTPAPAPTPASLITSILAVATDLEKDVADLQAFAVAIKAGDLASALGKLQAVKGDLSKTLADIKAL